MVTHGATKLTTLTLISDQTVIDEPAPVTIDERGSSRVIPVFHRSGISHA